MEDVIIQGDCLVEMHKIKDKSIDLILTDLPFQQTKNEWDVNIPFKPLWEHYNRIIKDNGAIVLFGQGMFTADLMRSNSKMWRYNLIWKTGNRSTGFLNANRMPMRNHQDILVFYKKLPTYNPQFRSGIPLHSKGKQYLTKQGVNNNYGYYDTSVPEQRAGSTQKYPISVLDFDKPHPPIHPTEKPIKLCEWLIKTYTNENEIVLDSCMGIGTTALATMNTNRRFIGIELHKQYFEWAEENINNKTRRFKLLKLLNKKKS